MVNYDDNLYQEIVNYYSYNDAIAALKIDDSTINQYAFADYVNEPYIIDNMTGHDLAVERSILRDSLAVGKSRLQAIEDELAHRIKNGDASTGLTVVSKQSNRWYWNIGTEQAIALCA